MIERIGLRPLAGSARIAPLLATIGIGLVLDQCVQLVFSPDPRALPSRCRTGASAIGGGTIGALDLLIAGDRHRQRRRCCSASCASRKLGWAVRATAQDRDAARQMGVDVDAVNRDGVRDRLGARRPRRAAGRDVLQPYRPEHELPGDAEGRRRAGDRRAWATCRARSPAALLLGLTESYGVALFGIELPQPVRLRAADAGAGAAAERVCSPRPRRAAGAADRHVHRAAAGRCSSSWPVIAGARRCRGAAAGRRLRPYAAAGR